MKGMKVSIITVSYNAAATIEQTILSVLNQTWKNIEYIIIDGYSTDGTQAVVEKYRNALAYYVSEPDEGLYYAMNKGIEKATGEIVGIINSDDWYEPDAVEKMVNCFQNTGAELVYGNVWHIYKNGTKKRSIRKPLEQIWYAMAVSHPSVFIKREIYEKYGTFNTKYKITADYDLLLRMYVQGVKFLYLDEMIANFREGGISNANLQCADEHEAVVMTYINQCPEKETALAELKIQLEERRKNARFRSVVKESSVLIYDVLAQKFSNPADGVIIWGCGAWGERIFEVLEKCNTPVKFFVDSNEKKWGTEIAGTSIKAPESLKNSSANVIVAVKDYAPEICERLEELNTGGLRWITLEELQRETISKIN